MKLLDLVIATSNPGKLKEIKAKFSRAKLNINLYSADEFINTKEFDIPETGLTFVENAIIKARALAKISKLPALADDSGLVVEALGGKPGIYSARYAGLKAEDNQNLEKLLFEMREIPETFRNAYTYSSLALLLHEDDPAPLLTFGKMPCEILTHPRGHHGFGYDPVLYIPTLKLSLAEMPLELKNEISHRALALDRMIEKILKK